MSARRAIAVPRAWLPWLATAALLGGPASLHAQGQADAARAPGEAALALSGDGPYYRLTLPLALYGQVAQGDLSRLRIHNAANQPVPWAWLDAASAVPETPRTHSAALPIYPVPETVGTAAVPASPAFTLDTSGRLQVLAAPPPVPGAPAQWLIDLGALPGRLLQLRLALDAEAQGVFPFTLQGSDDLKQWRPVGGSYQVLRLPPPAGVTVQTLERLDVEVPGDVPRFLRLRWRAPQAAPLLRGVEADSLLQLEPAPPAPQWSDPITPASCGVEFCDYVLPLYGLRIELAQPDTLAPLTVAGLADPAAAGSDAAEQPRHVHNPLYALRQQTRQRPQAVQATGEIALLDTVVYRLRQAGGEIRSETLALDGAVWPRLRLRTHGPIAALGAVPPTLEVSSLPRTARLSGPGYCALPPALAGACHGACRRGPAARRGTVPGHVAAGA
ncbi:MAG: hypothetical protein GAK30_00162 [Paracidovorax wautersii]|uniref:F5/8 type C domain-containing protein n=1 Tax=Paracidovorax wautersii TaxID=1177982 RepID=A0A7V8JS62_9BURK|nr:MAG: hypothetical protein GAK30_00162 [Paracidovorax wautersii]